MLLRRRKGKKYIHMYLYNYYIIFVWGISCIFIITGGLCEMDHQQEQQQQQQQPNSPGKALIKEAIKSNLLRLLNLKEVPKPPVNKAYVPVEMLREYVKYRDLVRMAIPDDREFFGKIILDDLHPSDHNFWNEVGDRYSSHGIEIDMTDEDNSEPHKKFLATGDLSQISAIQPEREPEEIDPKLEPLLPPYHKNLRQFSSVQIKYNLSQEMYQKPYGSDQVKGAILTINREKLLDCQVGKCDNRGPQQTTTDQQTSSKSSPDEQNTATGHYIPFYQRLYINHITGYDQDGTPRTYILHSQRLDTRQSNPITYDISRLVKEWLKNPEKNYGIIVRVTNDDPEYDKFVSNQQTNASTTTTTTDARVAVLEHVRLKRGFRSTSDAEDSWLRQKPTLTLYFKDNNDDETRHNVKRADKLDEDMDGAQADAPDSSADFESSKSSSFSSSQSASNKPKSRMTSQNRRPTEPKQQQPSNRNPSSRNSAGPTQRHKSGNKGSRVKDKHNTKCSKTDLTINFDEVGWSNWIIAPSSYKANYCSGDCTFPLSDYQNSTNHAIIQAIFHSVGRNVPRTCCAPTRLGRMAILFQLERSVQMKYYDDMIVEECGCL